MKKTSKRFLSLFLALVMVITTCSVGLTAFAADDSGSVFTYINDEGEAVDLSYSGLKSLVNTYAPAVIELLGDTLSGIGVDADEVCSSDDPIYELIAQLSPVLMGLIAGTDTAEDVLSGYTPLDSVYYSYLEEDTDDSSAMNFWTLYNFCKENRNKIGNDEVTKEYCSSTYEALNELLNAYSNVKSDFESSLSEAQTVVENLFGIDNDRVYNVVDPDNPLSELLGDSIAYSLDDIGNAVSSTGQTLDELDAAIGDSRTYNGTDLSPFFEYVETILKYTGFIDENKSLSLKELLYYYYNADAIFNSLTVKLATSDGNDFTVSTDFGDITYHPGDRYTDVMYSAVSLEQFYSFLLFENKGEMTLEEIISGMAGFGLDVTEQQLDDFYQFYMNFITSLGDFSYGEYETSDAFYSSVKETLVLSGLFESGEAVDEVKTSYAVTDEELEIFKEVITRPNLTLSTLQSAIKSSDLKGPTKLFLLSYATNSNYAKIQAEFDNWSTGDAYGTYAQAIIDGTPDHVGKYLYAYYFYAYDFSGNNPSYSFVPTFAEDVIIYHYCLSEKMNEGGYSYSWEDYKPDSEQAIHIVNCLLNGYIDQYLNASNDIGAILVSVIDSLLDTSIDVQTALHDIYLDLANDPIDAIFSLLPTLVVILDEFSPFLLNGPKTANTKEDYYYSEKGTLYTMLFKAGALLEQYGQDAGSETGIGQMRWDLNELLPDLMHWLNGDNSYTYTYYNISESTDDEGNTILNYNTPVEGAYGTKYDAAGVKTGLVPVIFNIYAIDKYLGAAAISDLTEGMLQEIVSELALFFTDVVDEYVAEHSEDIKGNIYSGSAGLTPLNKGLNNVSVALPKLIDGLGKKFMEKYNVDSDWYFGTFDVYSDGNNAGCTYNVGVYNFKQLAATNAPGSEALKLCVDGLVNSWINALFDFLNDAFQDGNAITNEIPIIQGLVEALGGFGEESIFTEIFNSIFQMQRSSLESFTFETRDNGYVGLSTYSAYFLLINIQNIIDVIMNLVNQFTDSGSNSGDTETASLTSVLTALLASDGGEAQPVASTATGATGYTDEELSNVTDLIHNIDNLLSSILSDSTINGYTLDEADNIFASLVDLFSRYLGLNSESATTLIDLLDTYLYYINGGKSAHKPDSDGNVKDEEIYTDENLTNLVVQTYALVESIVDYLVTDTFGIKNDAENYNYNLVTEAINGIYSPDSVAIRLSDDYSDAQKEFAKLSDWHSAVKNTVSAVPMSGQTRISVDWGIEDGDKDAFYNALASSLNLVSKVLAVLLIDTGWYETIVAPILNAVCEPNGISVKSASEYGTTDEAVLLDLLTPVSEVLNGFLDAPATTLLNILKGAAGILDDSSGATIDSIIADAIDPIANEINGLGEILDKDISNLSPTAAQSIYDFVNDSILSLKDITLNDIPLNGSNLIAIINSYISSYGITLPEIDWSSFKNSTPADIFVYMVEYALEIVFSDGVMDLIGSLFDDSSDITSILDMLKEVEVKDILAVLNEILEKTDNPTLVYWSFVQYLQKMTDDFVYPAGITAAEAKEVVTDLDNVIGEIMPLLAALGLDIGDDLSSVVYDNLYTNDIITSLAKTLYGALDTGSVADIMEYLNIDVSPQGVAALLVDTSYGKTYTDAADAIKNAKKWSKVGTVSWGFKDGTEGAKKGFVNALAAIFRPFNDLLSVFLAGEALELNETLYNIIYNLKLSSGEKGDSLYLRMSKGVLTIKFKDTTTDRSGYTTIKINFTSLQKTLSDVKIYGTNGYDNAIIPVLEAFGCSGIVDYSTYIKDYNKAKDNLLLDILKPILYGSDCLLADILEAPVKTIATILPNIAAFIDANGIMTVLNNLLSPITSIIESMSDALHLDDIITEALGQDLGSFVADALGMDSFTLSFSDLSSCNIQDLLIPVVNLLLPLLGVDLEFSNIDWAYLASLGTAKTYKSKASSDGVEHLTGKKVVGDTGKVLITVLRYLIDNLTEKNNLKELKSLLYSIESISGSEIIVSILDNVFKQLKNSSTDQIIVALFYFFIGDGTNALWDYTGYKTKSYNFSYPAGVTSSDVSTLIRFADGLIQELDLGSLLNSALYTDDIINQLAELIYVDLNDMKILGSITVGDILGLLDISFDIGNVSDLLTDSDYGKSYKKVASALDKAKKWSKVNFDKLSWGVTDEESFLNALVALLRPFYGVLEAVLADGSLDILKGISIPGSNGYENSVVPLLEAFKCSGIVSYNKYLKDINKAYDNMLLDILNPLMDLVDDVLEAPVETIASILPNVSLFIANDGILQLITNLITPVAAVCEAINPIIDVDALLQTLLGMDDISVAHIDKLLDQYIGADSLIPLINSLLASTGITIPEINWFKLAGHGTVKKTTSAVDCIGTRLVVDANVNETVIAFLCYVLDAVLANGDAIKSLIGDVDESIENSLDMIFSLSGENLVSAVFAIVSVTQSPTEIFWCYEYYKSLNASFSYPAGISATDAENAIGQLDDAVTAVFALLQGLDFVDSGTLSGLVNDLLYTNDILTSLATALYGALDTNEISPYLEMMGIDVSTAGVAKLLTDSSYGKTYSSAAATIANASGWKSIKSINWGFSDGAANAEQGFINGLVAIFRPFNDILAAFLVEGDLELGEILYNVLVELLGENGILYLNDAKTISFDLTKLETLKTLDIKGTNAYESTIIPLLDVFQCENVISYAGYKTQYKSAKDNLLLNIFNPVFDFVDDVLEAPFDTVTKVLPNVAYFIGNNGIGQLLNNLLAPVTEALKEMKSYGLDIDAILAAALGDDLGSLIEDMLNVDVNLNITLCDLNSCNVQDILIPLINSLIEDYGIRIPDISWLTIASHGTVQTSSSAAHNSTGALQCKEVIADQGEVLIAVLRYLAKTITSNMSAIKSLLLSIDDVGGNDTIAAIVISICNTLGTVTADQLISAIFYFLTEEPTNAFWDYTSYVTKEYDFSYPENIDIDFLTNISPMVDGLIGSLADLNSLIGEALFTDKLINGLVGALYPAIDGVSISDSMSLSELLALTGIDFTKDNFVKLLTDKKYGQTYESNAKIIASASSWAKVDFDSLKWGVTDRDSFFNALCAALRPIYGVLDVLLNDASLGLFNIVYLPGSNGYTSTLVPLMEAFGLYNIKTQYQYRQDINEAYDNILLDIINPLWDKVEDILSAPLQTLADMLPDLSLFIANDGLLQLIDNLATPISALIDAIKPVVDLNDLIDILLDSMDVDLNKELANLGLNIKLDIDLYDLSGMLEPIIGADNLIPLINDVLGMITISGASLDLELMDVDWYQLASHGNVLKSASQAATYGTKVYVEADASETLIAVLRYLIDTVNYKDNYQTILNLISGLLGDSVDESITSVIDQILGLLQNDTDSVIADLCELLQTFA